MEVMHRICAGMDVHKDSVVVCVRSMKGNKVDREVRTFGTMTSELLKLGDWLEERGCPVAVIEATGVYWKPVWQLLSHRVELVLANAHEVRNVPGRKSDMNDATWLADLLAHGLVRASFVPPEPIADLRDLTRTRKQLSREIVEHTQRIQKVLETCNIKLASVATDILGVSGRAMLTAIVGGEDDPVKLAQLARGTLRAKYGQLVEALRGRVRDHHRGLIAMHLRLIDSLQEAIAGIEKQIEDGLRPFAEAVALLETIPVVQVHVPAHRHNPQVRLHDIEQARAGVDVEHEQIAGLRQALEPVLPAHACVLKLGSKIVVATEGGPDDVEPVLLAADAGGRGVLRAPHATWGL